MAAHVALTIPPKKRCIVQASAAARASALSSIDNRAGPRLCPERAGETRAVRCILDDLYERFNRRDRVSPDPVEFLYAYPHLADREIAGLVAASLAYGRVVHILKSVSDALGRMDASPAAFLRHSSAKDLRRAFRGFRHRFTSGEDLANLLAGARQLIDRHGSLGGFFCATVREEHETILPALSAFVREMDGSGFAWRRGLLPSPQEGSACKRPNLFLRWMVRRDEVDPGGWDGVPASKLLVPLDTHMHRVGLSLGFARRSQPDLQTVLAITEAFRRVAPEDPVRYDFALTRLGMRGDGSLEAFLETIRGAGGAGCPR